MDSKKRSMLQFTALSALSVLAAATLTACNKAEAPAPAAAPAAAPASAAAPKPASLKIAFAFVGPVGDGG